MTELIDDDDLALLTASFGAAATSSDSPAEAQAKLFDLGWGELLAVAPARGAAAMFTTLGSTGSAAPLLDDVLAIALGLDVAPATVVIAPAPHARAAPGRRDGPSITVDGLVSSRLVAADVVVLAVTDGDRTRFHRVDAALVRADTPVALDPERPFRRVRLNLDASDLAGVDATASWDDAVAAARRALAHQLIGAARWMLDQGCQHAVDRVQFGRPISSFQAVRHKLAESLVAIDGAASIAELSTADPDPLLAAAAKATAGIAARTTAGHVQQVLAGIGFTTEHHFHLWLKRSLVLDTLFGSARSIPTEIGTELLSRGVSPRLVEL